MRVYCILTLIILTSCKTVELKQPVWYFWPVKLHLGTDISVVSGQLSFDTTKYSVVGFAQHIKEYRLKRSDLDKWNFNNNYFDSVRFSFYGRRLFAIDLYASGNPKVEYLKYEIRGGKESGLTGDMFFNKGTIQSTDTTFEYGKYRGLYYRSRDGHMIYEYHEDIVDNIAVLTILNERMIKTMPRKSMH
jgi:hypothetical protein